MYVPKSFSLVVQGLQVQRILSVAAIAGWIHCNKYSVAGEKCFAVEAERREFPRIIHFQCPGLADFYTFSRSSVRDIDYLNENERMRVDQLEVLHFHFGDEPLLSIVDASDGVMPPGGDTPGQNNSNCSDPIHKQLGIIRPPGLLSSFGSEFPE